jgi:hypothetical protein
MLTCGTQRFTREHFVENSRVVEICSRGGPSEMKYPCNTTLKTKVEPCAIEFAYAGSLIQKIVSSQPSINSWEDVSLNVPIKSTGPPGQGTDNTNQSRADESGRERPVVVPLLRCQKRGGAIHGDDFVVRTLARCAQQNRVREA